MKGSKPAGVYVPGVKEPEPGRKSVKPKLIVRLRPYLIIAPALLMTVGILYPFGLAIYYTFTNRTLMNPNPQWIGLYNYKMLFGSREFWHSLGVTLRYAVWSTVFQTLLGMLVALLLNRETRLTKALRTVMIFPLLISPVIGSLIWKLMMQPSVGILNDILKFFGLRGLEWAAHPDTAMFSVVLIDSWIFTPFVALLILAGLQSMPKEPFEAARVDGGSPFFVFRTLTLPLLKPFLLIALVFRLIDSLKMFDIIYSMTGGGPGDTLMNFPLQAYYHGYMYMNLSHGLTYMILLWVVIYIISQVIISRWSKAMRRASGL